MIEKVVVKQNDYAGAAEFVKGKLAQSHATAKKIEGMTNAFEEAFGLLAQSADSKEEEITIELYMSFSKINIKLSVKGSKIGSENPIENFVENIENSNHDEIVRNASINLIRAYTDSFSFTNKAGINQIRLSCQKKNQELRNMAISITSAVLLGFILKALLPMEICKGVDSNVLTPIKTMFLNALKMASVPVVFFSMSSCISGFSNMEVLGRIGGKILSFYLITTTCAILIAMGISALFGVGDPSIVADVTETVVGEADVSMLSMLVNIVPSNFVGAFASADMLQVMFLAILVGVGVAKTSDKNNTVIKDFLQKMNEVFMWITTAIVSLAPIAVFCGITSLVLNTGIEALITLMEFLGTFIAALACMIIIYMLIISIFGHLNPFVFMKKYLPAMISSFSLASSNASLPINMKTCTKDLGVDSQVATFSLPLGATINMDGTSIYLVVSILFLAKSFGLDVTPAMLLSIGLSAFVFSVGSPGITGAGLVCLAALATLVGLPAASISILVGIDPIMSMFRAASNCAGDVAVTVTVANSEKKLNKEAYYRQ